MPPEAAPPHRAAPLKFLYSSPRALLCSSPEVVRLCGTRGLALIDQLFQVLERRSEYRLGLRLPRSVINGLRFALFRHFPAPNLIIFTRATIQSQNRWRACRQVIQPRPTPTTPP